MSGITRDTKIIASLLADSTDGLICLSLLYRDKQTHVFNLYPELPIIIISKFYLSRLFCMYSSLPEIIVQDYSIMLLGIV